MKRRQIAPPRPLRMEELEYLVHISRDGIKMVGPRDLVRVLGL